MNRVNGMTGCGPGECVRYGGIPDHHYVQAKPTTSIPTPKSSSTPNVVRLYQADQETFQNLVLVDYPIPESLAIKYAEKRQHFEVSALNVRSLFLIF